MTLLIIENAKASTANGNNANHDFSFGAGYSTDRDQGDANVNVGMDHQAGEGRQRSGTLTAAITVWIKEKKDDLLKVSGSQEIIVDGEKQFISVSGWVRASDISRENTVVSTRLSDAAIEYSGYDDGAKDTGFFSRMFSWW